MNNKINTLVESHLVGENHAHSNTCKHNTDFMEQSYFGDIEKQMAALKAAIFHVTETNATKIQFIKEELASGRYQIESELIAERMLEHAITTHAVEEAVETV